MKRVIWILICWLSLSPFAYSAVVCTTLNTSTWTPEQKALAASLANEIAGLAGAAQVPTISGSTLCFTNPPFVVGNIITETALLNASNTDRTRDTSAQTTEAALRAEFAGNLICTESLAQIDSDIDTAFTGVIDIINLQTQLRVYLKKLARCTRAHIGI